MFQNVPPDLAICCFILEQSLSVRALQEMLSNTSVDEVRIIKTHIIKKTLKLVMKNKKREEKADKTKAKVIKEL